MHSRYGLFVWMSPTQGRKLTMWQMWEEVREGRAEVSRMKYHPPLRPHKDPTEPTKETGADYVLGDIVHHVFLMADENLTSFVTN